MTSNSHQNLFVTSVVLSFWLGGCITTSTNQVVAGYDGRPLMIQTLSAFNQRTPSKLSPNSWRGDWVFRRDRLDLVDHELRSIRPDILVLQEVMAKEGSRQDQDREILAAGSLADYLWESHVTQQFLDTQENEALVVAVGAPAKFGERRSPQQKSFWSLGDEGFLSATTVEVEGESLAVFNVQLPTQELNYNVWMMFLQERVQEFLKSEGICSQRVVIAGYIPYQRDSQRMLNFMNKLNLKDASAGYCEVAARCYTSSPSNDIFLATEGDQAPAQTDRIFVSRSAIVASSTMNFQNHGMHSAYKEIYGIEKLWPTKRFGWGVSVRFAHCANGA